MRLSRNLVRQIIPNVPTVIVVALMLVVFRARAMPAAQNTGPGVISYQGTLTDTGTDQPVEGNVDMTFRLYDVSVGGTALWTEMHADANAVPVTSGLFNVLLGSLTPIPSTVWENASLFLEITVGGEELVPREAVGSVPHAMYAVHADLAYNLSAPDGDPVHAATVDEDGAVHVEGGWDASLAGGGQLVVGPESDTNIVMDGNEIMARDNGSPSSLYLQHEGGELNVGGDLRFGGSLVGFESGHVYESYNVTSPGDCGSDHEVMTPYTTSFCVLTQVRFDEWKDSDYTDFARCRIYRAYGNWRLEASTSCHGAGYNPQITCEAVCLEPIGWR